MKIRTGRRNRHNLYLQAGDEPSNDDLCLGFMIDPEVSALICEAFISPWYLGEIKIQVEAKR